MLTPRMLPAWVLFLLPLRFRLALLLTDAFFFKVPLREGAAPWFNVDAREEDRWGVSSSMRIEAPRVCASNVSSNLPRR
jgi:hypothetical protein